MRKEKVLSCFFLILLIGVVVYIQGNKVAMNKVDGVEFIQEVGGIQEFALKSNGLKVLLLEDHSSPVATLMLTYLVGSRHESDKFRGGAHLLEHMMFKGTPTYNKENGNAIPKELQRTGALLNASTWKDGTNYYESLPSDKLHIALNIESDRMRNSFIRREDFVSEMPVVQSEFDRLENSPLVALDLATWDKAYTEHNYHYPIIGIREDLEEMPIETLQDFYNTYYWPNNAVLAIIGDFNTASLLEEIVTKFGSIKKSNNKIPQPDKVEAKQTQPRVVNVQREDQLEAVLIAHKTPPATHEDTPIFDVLGYILSRGKTSRLYRTLVEQGAAVEVYSESSKSHDPGLFFSEVILTPQANHDLVKQAILSEYHSIQNEGVTAAELERAKNKLRAQVAYSRDGSYSLAHQLSMAIAAGDWTLFSTYVDKLNSVTSDDVKRIANKYFTAGTMTQSYLVSKDPQLASEKDKDLKLEVIPHVTKETMAVSEEKYEKEKEIKIPSGSLASRVKTEEVHGINLYTSQTGVKDVLTLMGSFEGAGHAYSDKPILAEMVLALLDEGTKKRSKFEIAQILEDRGAKITFQIDQDRVGFHARCLTKDIPIVVELISEQLRTPLFNEADLNRVKEQQKVLLRQAMNDTSAQAHTALTHMIYQKNHSNYESSFEEQLKSLSEITIDDIKNFHSTHYGPNEMIFTAVGDINHQTLVAALTQNFNNWPAPSISKTFETKVSMNTRGERNTIPLPDKVKVDATFGHALGLTRNHEDYLPLYVANVVLGGDFSARLASTVRDEQGLTYSVHSEIQGIDAETEGHWQINIILNNQVLEKGIKATMEQIEKFVNEGLSSSELTDKIETIVGKYKVGLSTSGGLAHRILRNAEFKFPLSYLDEYPELIEKLSVEQVNQTIKQYFSPKNLHLVVSGTLDEQNQSSAI